MYSTPASSQRVDSEALIGRDASEMSVSFAANRLKPPPVPDTPTVTWTLGEDFLNVSATASVSG